MQMPNDSHKSIDEKLAGLRNVLPESKYYLICLLADEKLAAYIEMTSHWTGWSDAEMQVEIRAPSVVNANYLVDFWNQIEVPYCVVNIVDEMGVFMIAGGNGIVNTETADLILTEHLSDHPVVRTGRTGFKSQKYLDGNTFQRSPSPKKRMAIFKRDEKKCRICGRKPENNSDIELHIHHIRPWSKRGVTDPDNLITLCHTCHKGLDPHDDESLFELLPGQESGVAIYKQRILVGTINYRKSTQMLFS
jgi:hypothetical protein